MKPALIEQRRVDLVAIALAASKSSELQEILALCEPFKLPVRLVPALGDVIAVVEQPRLPGVPREVGPASRPAQALLPLQ